MQALVCVSLYVILWHVIFVSRKDKCKAELTGCEGKMVVENKPFIKEEQKILVGP